MKKGVCDYLFFQIIINIIMDRPEYILNEVNKGIKMGMDSISTISEKVTDSNFKDDLQYEYNKYNEILNQVNNELEKLNI